MKIILSRKGVDSGTGNCASPIVEGRPISLPIPTKQPTATRYRDLAHPIGELARDLSKNCLGPSQPCHLDPDIDRHALPGNRPKNWRGAFGQVDAALGHLRKQGVGPGDLFIFFGLFRDCERKGSRWAYSGPKRHAIFGWIEVAEVVDLESDRLPALARHPWLAHHPHARPGWKGKNKIFIAKEHLSFGPRHIPGYGVFRRPHFLTAANADRTTCWEVPSWLDMKSGGVGMTYHPPERWLGKGRVRAAARGQEFIANAGDRRDARDWFLSLFADTQGAQ